MSRIAVISDVHGNLHALRAVLASIRARRIRDVICLGDVVGYGPAPGECLDLVLETCRHTILGNHDEAAFNPHASANFNGNARIAIDWTRRALLQRHLQTLQILPQIAYVEDRAMCVHDCPVPGPTDYVHDAAVAAMAFRGVDLPICLVGHTHVPAVFEAPTDRPEDQYRASDVSTVDLRDGQSVQFQPGRRYICNPGSVGQPRDADPRASYGVLDLRRKSFTVHRTAYDINAAQLDTQRAGLPSILARRLAMGA